MPLDLGFGDIGDDVVFELASRFEIGAAALGALLGMNIVFDELGTGRRIGPDSAAGRRGGVKIAFDLRGERRR